MFWRSSCGQATIEAALCIPVLFVALLMLVQPGIILYDRIVMRSAASDACRMLATRNDEAGFDEQRYLDLVKRHLGAVPPSDLFHIHDPQCSWSISLSGDESDRSVSVSISNTLRLLPLFDAAGAWSGIADNAGCYTFSVSESATSQPSWTHEATGGFDPDAWIDSRAA